MLTRGQLGWIAFTRLVGSVYGLAGSSATELFSVAPMMGHTNRHYRYFFRQLSEHAYLYTEMIPAGQVLQSYEQALHDGNPLSNADNYHVEKILENVQIIQDKQSSLSAVGDSVLEEMLNPGIGNIVLQLGGRNPELLAKAAAVATAFGYDSINLNCGCPSTSVSGRQSGAALMKEPELVAQCLEAMSYAMDEINPNAILSVKHRLGVADASTYNPTHDHAQNDEEAFQSCRNFVQIISLAGSVSRIQVHARVALLGFDSNLWVPAEDDDDHKDSDGSPQKINHQRAQYEAKRQARQATLKNRSVPPLRPRVVEQIAQEFPHLQVVSNGGIDSINNIQERLSSTNVVGGMAGRAAINHPCSFAGVDSSLWKNQAPKNTRQTALENYISYCEKEESRLSGLSRNDLQLHRRKLVAAPFHLFMGEEGNNAFQRRLRKLVSRADRHPAHSMLSAAMAEIPTDTLAKSVNDHVPSDQIETYDFTKRAGAMQRTIY
jgi:tRNA-dihydrouridine synthase A